MMNYVESYSQLKEAFEQQPYAGGHSGVTLVQPSFASNAYTILPGSEKYYCPVHARHYDQCINRFADVGAYQGEIHLSDITVPENREFTYTIIKPTQSARAKRVILLLHGFNEKHWDKYYPWGESLCRKTQSAVIFFPMAFHMQRAPSAWSNKRSMFLVSENRRRRYPDVLQSTLSNVAISIRLHSMPQRFIWSGLQTYFDVVQLLLAIRSDQFEHIHPAASFDFFGYSIGGFLAMVLKMTNHRDLFGASRLGLFCSGAVFNRMSPVSRFILDSEANVALYSYLIEHLDSHLKNDPWLRHFLLENHREGEVFRSMLQYQRGRELRETLLQQYESQIFAIGLKHDLVVPTFEIRNTLLGANRQVGIPVLEEDFDYAYSHENPFPVQSHQPQLVNAAFERVFSRFADFYSS